MQIINHINVETETMRNKRIKGNHLLTSISKYLAGFIILCFLAIIILQQIDKNMLLMDINSEWTFHLMDYPEYIIFALIIIALLFISSFFSNEAYICTDEYMQSKGSNYTQLYLNFVTMINQNQVVDYIKDTDNTIILKIKDDNGNIKSDILPIDVSEREDIENVILNLDKQSLLIPFKTDKESSLCNM